MKNNVLKIGVLLASLILSSCNPTTSSLPSSQTSESDVTTSIQGNYDDWVESWSEQGHLYIHYLRPKASANEYNDWAIWLWQNAPIDSEGTLWGASNSSVQNIFYEMSTSWMSDIGGSGANIDQSGRVMDIDMTRTDLKGGKTGTSVSLINATRLGFLIIDQNSMDGGSHWTSDGGANTYIQDFDKHLAEKGYVHIYCVQGNVGGFTFQYSDDIVENPVVNDDTGNYRSQYDVDSSSSNYGVSKTSQSFSSLGVGYQIFVASFKDSDGDGMGDLRGVINSLDYLAELGVQVLWLTPIQASESYHGYDITDFYAVDSKFGTIEDYRELIYKAHQKGMKVLMDLVINHTSKNNVWFKKSQRAEKGVDEFGNEIDYRNMYHWKFKGDKVQYYENGSYKLINVENHPDWYKDGESNYYYYGKFGSNMAELNYDCQATRDLIINMALYWMGFGLDGFRLDAVKHIYMKDEVESTGNDIIIEDYGEKTYYDEEKMEEVTTSFDYSSDLTKNVNFWKEFANRIKYIFPDCFLVGENFDGWGTRIAPYYQALDSQFDFALYYHNREWLYDKGAVYMAQNHAGETYDRFASNSNATLGDTGVRVEGGKRSDFINSAFTSNHDTMRLINQMSNTDHITGTALQVLSSRTISSSSSIRCLRCSRWGAPCSSRCRSPIFFCSRCCPPRPHEQTDELRNSFLKTFFRGEVEFSRTTCILTGKGTGIRENHPTAAPPAACGGTPFFRCSQPRTGTFRRHGADSLLPSRAGHPARCPFFRAACASSPLARRRAQSRTSGGPAGVLCRRRSAPFARHSSLSPALRRDDPEGISLQSRMVAGGMRRLSPASPQFAPACRGGFSAHPNAGGGARVRRLPAPTFPGDDFRVASLLSFVDRESP